MRFIKRFLLFLIVFGVVSFIVYLLVDNVVMPYLVNRRDVRILLDVRNMPWDQAASLLRREGFIPMRGESKPSSEHEPFTVLDQRPGPGSKVRLGRRVYLDVSTVEKEIPFPNLIGKTLRGAEITLRDHQMEIDTVLWDYSNSPAGVVFKQSIEPGTYVRPGSAVVLYVSLGIKSITVPDVVGMSQFAAIRKLESVGLEVKDIHYVIRNDLLAFTVLSQSIEGGTVLKEPRGITLVVSQLPEDAND
ncbi:MAG: PASTA domain-containing protein [Candidatus Marinimicrobia bacterium]|nr:PASTA domain-containing protein [Candidatus Neomarinimicrobiota bacterium]MDD5583324.1 PASTA domain-containing protein [Candidatus Neomarinimicrobiota bacterium]